jgi:transposase
MDLPLAIARAKKAAKTQEHNVAGPKKLSAHVVKTIFEGTESAPAAAKRFKVSPNLVYLIRARRIHKGVTEGLRAPRRPTRRRSNRQAAPKVDINRLADAVARRVVKMLTDRLRGKA